MRKFFTLLTLCLLASAAWATDITFVPSTDKGTGSTTAGAFYIEKDGVRIDVENGLVNDTQYRFYKNKNVTISSTAGDVTKVVFECTASGDAQYGPGCFTANVGEYGYDGAIGTWQGQATSVVFTAATNQVRATKVTVTIGEAGLSAPVIKPAGGTYYEPIQVSITCSTSGAKIYYTTNGSTPTTSSTQYSAPFTLNAATTVKAISEKDGETSDVVSAEYNFATATPVANIAAYSATDDETVVKFSNPVSAVAQNGKYLYVKDNSGFGLFFGSLDQTYTLGDVIPAGFVGKKTTYGGEPELTDLSGFKPATDNVPFDPEAITTANVDHAHWAHYVYFESATIDPDAKTITDAAGTAPVYFSMGLAANQVTAGVEYEVWGVVGSYKPSNGDVVYQLLPIKVKRKGAGGVGIGNMGDYEDNTMLTFEYDATVLYHGNSRLFVKDATGYGLIYGNVGQTYKQGNVIPAGYGGKKTTYGGEPELAATFSGFQPSSGNVTVTPEPATVNDINHEHFAHFVVLSNVDIIEVSGNNFKVKDANGNICNGYNQFGQDVQEGHYDQLKGIVGSYGNTNTVYQLLPLIDAPIVNVRNIPELYALNSGRQGKFTQPLTAIYQNNLNLYVQDIDGNYGMVYGSVPGEFVNGDKIVEPVASWTTYNNYKEIIPADGFTVGGHGTPVEPDEWMIEDISQDMIHAYIKFMDVEVVLDSVNYYRAIDETGEIVLYNQFKLEFPEPEAGATYDVTGFVSLFKGNLQIYPLTIEKVGGGMDCGTQGDVNNDKEMNVADVNALIDIILSGAVGIDDCTRWRADVNGDGEINIADVNALIDLILSNH